jgi:phosphatidylethanolamine-binding protein (PEBP) family uncharacterized protein
LGKSLKIIVINVIMLIKTVFENNSKIPKKYTCDGEEKSPPLGIENVPEGTKSLVLIMDDPDVPKTRSKRNKRGQGA